jgi:hypothetical protein
MAVGHGLGDELINDIIIESKGHLGAIVPASSVWKRTPEPCPTRWSAPSSGPCAASKGGDLPGLQNITRLAHAMENPSPDCATAR